MKSIRFRPLCLVAVVGFLCLGSQWVHAQTPSQCASALPLGNVTGCGVLITITGSAAAPVATITVPGNGNPYDTDDYLVGVQNNSSASVSSINLTSNSTAPAFAFDADGPCQFRHLASCFGPTGYEGPNNTFTRISANKAMGTVNFTSPIAPAGSTWFALEHQPTGAMVSDQCSGALPLGSATGCGVLITINPGTTGSTSASITFPGNGNPYDGDEDTLVGIQNNSASPVSSINLTSNGNPLAFAFDHDGPCAFNQQDCFGGTTGYEGPTSKFSGISLDFASGTVNFTTPIQPGASTWFALENAPLSVTAESLGGQTIDPNNPQSLFQSFIFNNAPNNHVQFDFDYRTANGAEDLTVQPNTVPTVTNQGVSQFTYHQMVAGTSLATTNCYSAPGEGNDSNGSPLCAQQTLTCTNQNNSTPAGDNCPQSSERNDLWDQIVDTPDTINIPAGTAPTFAMGSDTWSPGNCTLVGPEAGNLCPRSQLTQFSLLQIDPTTRMAGTGKTSNSSYVGGCCAPTWQTVATIPLWNRTTTVNFTLTSNPPTPPPLPDNGWVAAPNQSLTSGWEAFGHTPDTTFPVPGDVTVNNPIACPSQWPAHGTVPPTATATGSATVQGEGAFELHFFSTACDNQQELVFTPQPNGVNWASFKTQPFNVDQTAPVFNNSLVLSPPPVNGTYFANQVVKATLTCTDPISGGVASGIASCGPGSTNFNGQNPVTVTNVPLTTYPTGTYSFGATDLAGNASVAFTYTVVPALAPADVDVIEIGPLTAKSGSSATFIIGAWNKGPSAASNVVVASTLPAGETLVSANFAMVTCTLAGCSTPPPGAAACTLITSNSFSCTVPSLPAIQKGARSFTGIGVKVVTTITAQKGAVLKNTATVNASNPNPDTDNTFTWTTKVY